MPGIFAFMGWDPQTPLRGWKGGYTPPYSYKYLFTGIRYNLRNAIKNGDVVKKFWNLLFLIPKTYKKHGKVVSCLANFFNLRDSSGQLWWAYKYKKYWNSNFTKICFDWSRDKGKTFIQKFVNFVTNQNRYFTNNLQWNWFQIQ